MTGSVIEETWADLIIAVVSAALGWFTRYFVDKRKR